MTLGLKFVFPSLTGASAYIVATSYQTDEDGSVLLTPDCAGIEELEAYAAKLHADINKAVSEAGKRFVTSRVAGAKPLFGSN